MLGTHTARLPDCRPLLADPDDLTLVFQPIVDLAGATIAGYEALARFPGAAGPDVWFAAAAEAGIAAELEALAVHKALAVVDALPADTFLTVNVSPHILGSTPVQDALATRPDLRRVVVELTEHTPVHDLTALRRQCDELRARGALIALDDAGSGYSGLQQLAALRPQVVKLDRALVSDADTDPVRVALAEMLGEFAGRIDAWLLAEGIETPAELAAFAQLGVPLAQGWLLGRPSAGFAPLSAEATELVRAQVARARLSDTVAGLIRPIRQHAPDEELPAVPPVVLLGAQGEPTVLVLHDPRTGDTYEAPVSLRVHPTTDITEALQRALTRPPAVRFDPVLCTDRSGHVLGLLRIEDLAAAAPRRS
ncbi:EAL domain-containing protein [Blastococcus haudaquaticus]|uniref:EAL domain, c-di-GMP-specific phosphodiesterase class I (Or its enzymatically inactive variant) n=1 Tax=Blastococcus haudaquaticus TaxID=1938745 RepID=A0A286GYS6_9ACTN|nr:EAL domain-containing protein [Blastococcus haudaquaticus]SOE00224.1 EAL domain, c-di-GMP-specific phosphodiesterase class I (or its enzymatically inactive variant) [Blastococcus haudaquaticus]